MGASPDHQNIFIVGLAGPSGSGKSTLARRVAARLNGHVLSMETYSAEMSHLPLEERAKLDYDAPDASGKSVEAPIYDFAQHLREKNRREHIPAESLLIVEGILALHFAQLRPHFDFSVYLQASEEICFHRRKVRDIMERQRSMKLILWQWENTVLPAARRYLPPSKTHANLVLESESDLATVEKNLYEAILQKQSLAKNPG